VRQRPARYGDECPDRTRGDQGEDDAAAQREHDDERGRQDGVLPRLGERAGQRDGRAEDGADRGGPGPAEEGTSPAVAAQPVEPARSEQHEAERRREGDHRGQDAPGQAGRGVADHRHGLHDRAGGDLAERDGVEELRRGHPVVVAYRVRLHQRDDHETAAVGQRAHLERHPRYRQQHPARDRAAHQDRQGDDAARPAARAGGRVLTRALGGQLDRAAGHQDQRQPLPDGGGRRRSGQQVGHPARRVCASSPARAEQRPARLHGDRRDGGPGAGPGTMNAAPPASAPRRPRSRQAQKIASWVDAGPGSRLQAAIASSNSCASSHFLRSTHSSRSSLMWVGGPPKPMQPIRPHSRSTVARDTRAGPAAGPGGGTGWGWPPVSSGRLTAAVPGWSSRLLMG
jgi:hypothetical protein